MKPRFRTLRQRVHQMLNSKTAKLDGVLVDARAKVVGEDVRSEIIRGNYEFAERKLLRQVLRSGDRVLEIGAGIGVIGLLAARIVGASNVVSYEANPALEPVIRGNYALNGIEPKLEMKAVTPTGGLVNFFVTPSLLSSSLHSRDQHQEISVDSEAMSHVLGTHRPSVLVTDVEGAEIDLFPACDLAQVRALLIELHPNVVGTAAIERLETHLRERGFRTLARLHRNILLERPES